MIKILYGGSTLLRLEFPYGWDVSNLAGLNIGVYDRSLNELLAATAATTYTATSIDGDVEAEATSILLDSGAGALVPGDRVQIAAGADGPAEEVEVESYGSYTIEAKRPLLYAHADNAAVYGYWATYELDASDTDTFELGDQLVLEWVPSWTNATSDQAIIRQRAEVVQYQFAVPDFEERFAAVFPREHDALTSPYNRLPRFRDEALKQLQGDLKIRGFYLDRVVDMDVVVPALMQKLRWILLSNADERYSDEREVSLAEYHRQLDVLCNAPIWTDDDQDGELDDDEYSSHEHLFSRGF